MSDSQTSYYLPEPSHWPLVGSIALFTMMVGAAMFLNGAGAGMTLLGAGSIILIWMSADHS